MKKFFTLFVACSFVLALSAQSLVSSSDVSLSLTGGGQLTVKNLQGCATDISVAGVDASKYNGGESKTFSVSIVGVYTAMPDKKCGTGATGAPVTITYSPTLPIRFGTVAATWTADRLFVSYEAGAGKYRIQYATDGVNWVTYPQQFTEKKAEIPLQAGNIEGVHFITLNNYLGMTSTVPIRKPIAGGVEAKYTKLFVRVVGIDDSGVYTYSGIVTAVKK